MKKIFLILCVCIFLSTCYAYAVLNVDKKVVNVFLNKKENQLEITYKETVVKAFAIYTNLSDEEDNIKPDVCVYKEIYAVVNGKIENVARIEGKYIYEKTTPAKIEWPDEKEVYNLIKK